MTITKCDWCEREMPVRRVEIASAKVISSFKLGGDITLELCYPCQQSAEVYAAGLNTFEDMKEFAKAQVIKEKLIHDSDKSEQDPNQIGYNQYFNADTKSIPSLWPMPPQY